MDGARVEWTPQRPDIGRWIWIYFFFSWSFAMAALFALLGGSGASRLWALPLALLCGLGMVVGAQRDRRPINARSIEVAVDDTGITVIADGHLSGLPRPDVEQVTVMPLGNSQLWGPLAKFSGLYIRWRPGNRLARLPARQLFPVWGGTRVPGWELLLPLARSASPQVAEIRAALESPDPSPGPQHRLLDGVVGVER
jgi:hypothetical protein